MINVKEFIRLQRERNANPDLKEKYLKSPNIKNLMNGDNINLNSQIFNPFGLLTRNYTYYRFEYLGFGNKCFIADMVDNLAVKIPSYESKTLEALCQGKDYAVLDIIKFRKGILFSGTKILCDDFNIKIEKTFLDKEERINVCNLVRDGIQDIFKDRSIFSEYVINSQYNFYTNTCQLYFQVQKS